jgi:hypothetical protein
MPARQTALVSTKNASIVDFKQTNKMKQRKWIEDYFIQLAAYALAHDVSHGTKIEQGVIMMVAQNGETQEFVTCGREFDGYKDMWMRRVESFIKNSPSIAPGLKDADQARGQNYWQLLKSLDYLNPAVFFSYFLGCATNCFPLALPARFARVVAAYSEGLRLLIAALGRYRSPVSEDFLPLLVLHFWSPQSLRLFCGAFILVSVPAACGLVFLSDKLGFSG